MSTRQIEVCAARLPDRERAQFLSLMEQSATYFAIAVRLRRQAWQLYRDVTGLSVRGKTT